MNWLKILLPAVVLAGYAVPAQAQFFARKPRLPNLQVPELIATAKADSDERRRIAALEQLRNADTKAYPEVVPVLIDLMLNDAKSGIRLEAMHSLSRIRPITQTIGQALQQAAQRDESFRNRWQAKSSLWMLGYHGGNENQVAGPNSPTGKEPPLLGNGTVIVSPQVPQAPSQPNAPIIVPPAGVPTYVPSTPAPTPEAAPRPLPQGSTVSMPRPLPSRPTTGFSTAVPQQPMQVIVTPAPQNDDGPTIIPVP